MAKDEGSGEGQTVGGGEGGGGPPPEATATPPRRRVHEESDCSERAERAEARVVELMTTVAALERDLAAAQAALDQLEQRHRLERELERAGAIDLPTAVLLGEMARSASPDTDIDSVIAEMLVSKPYLFQNAATGANAASWPTPGAMSAAMAAHAGQGVDSLTTAAEEAAVSGDRAALLRYLQLRRQRA